jgi:hypothetical protein
MPGSFAGRRSNYHQATNLRSETARDAALLFPGTQSGERSSLFETMQEPQCVGRSNLGLVALFKDELGPGKFVDYDYLQE